MFKRTLIILPLALLVFAGCTGLKETANMSVEERFAVAMEYFNDESYDLAINEFEAIMLQFPGSEQFDDAQFYLAKSRFERREYLLGASEFSKLIRNIPASSFVPESQFMLAECYYQLSPPFSLDQRYSRKAIEELQAFIDFFPSDQRVPEAEQRIKSLTEKLAQKEFNSAYIYEKMEYFTAALHYYAAVAEIYHDTKYAPLASAARIRLLADRSRNKEALKEIENFIKRYPEDGALKEMLDLQTKIAPSVLSSN
ncbi:MAG: hypothetical protein AMXMBFR48_19300 [Ignavibacteriales bacterium]